MRPLVALALLVVDCFSDDPYTCASDSNCVYSGRQGGKCLSNGSASYCTYADSACGSGLRWSTTAAPSLASTCASESMDAGADLVNGTPPTVATVTPSIGPSTGGIKLAITGNNYQPGLSVTIDGMLATDATWISDTEATATLPAHLGRFGKVDVKVTNTDGLSGSAQAFSYYLGEINFSAPARYGTGKHTASIAAGDFNGDGKLDLAAENYDDANLSILLGHGDGTFAAAVNYGVGMLPADLVVKDFNGDGKLDVAVANSGSASASVLLGNGDGTLQSAVDYAAQMQPYAIASADVDGDGKLDLIVCNRSSDSISLLIGNGNGTFKTAVNVPVGTQPDHVAAGDFNRDGFADVAVANFMEQDVGILLWDKAGGIFKPMTLIFPGTLPSFILVDDLDLDGKLDLAVVSYDNGNGTGGSVNLVPGNGDGTFNDFAFYKVDSNPTCAHSGDFNLDGLPDLSVANAGSGTASVLINKGAGKFDMPTSYPAGQNAASVWVGDFNSDGKPDLATANISEADVSVLLNLSQ